MNIRRSTTPALGVSLAHYLEMKQGERPPCSRFIESGVFMFEGHTYCVVGTVGVGCSLSVGIGYVGLFNLKSQTIRQVRPDIIVVPVGAEILITEEEHRR